MDDALYNNKGVIAIRNSAATTYRDEFLGRDGTCSQALKFYVKFQYSAVDEDFRDGTL